MKEFKTVEEIKKERLLLKKNRNEEQATLLGVLLAELDRRPDLTKEPTADDIYKSIKKLYDAAIECGNESEKAYLEQFIRKQLSDEELRKVLEQAINEQAVSASNIGSLMKYLKDNYAGQYDGKQAATLASEVLKK